MARSQDFTQFGTTRTALELAFQDRLEDARALLAANRWASSIALHLYAFEILLKIHICRRLDLTELPIGFQLHEFDALLVLAGLYRPVSSLTAADPVKYSWDKMLAMNRRHVNELSYHPDDPANQPEAQEVRDSLSDPARGIMPWLQTIP